MPLIRDKSMRHKIRTILDKKIARTLPITWRMFLLFVVVWLVCSLIGGQFGVLITG